MNFKHHLFDKNNSAIRISHEEPGATNELATEINELLPSKIISRPVVFVCIGTDRSTGDSLGPLVGTLLKDKKLSSFFVYGTLEDPIHAVNLEEKVIDIKNKHFNPFIIAIDACLGRLKSVGFIEIGVGPIKPGAGVNKELPEVGHVHITGIVNVGGFMEFFVLQNTRLHLVLNMAKIIADGIYQASMSYKPTHFISPKQWNVEKEQLT